MSVSSWVLVNPWNVEDGIPQSLSLARHGGLCFPFEYLYWVKCIGECFQVDSFSQTLSVLQDVLTDLSAECENLPIEGVSGACYIHKVHSDATFLCWCLHRLQVRCFLVPEINMFMSLSAGHLPGSKVHPREAGEWWHPEPGLLHCTSKRNSWDQQSQLQQRCLLCFSTVLAANIRVSLMVQVCSEINTILIFIFFKGKNRLHCLEKGHIEDELSSLFILL